MDLTVDIQKRKDDERLAFGWLYCTRRADGSRIIDLSQEYIEIDDLRPLAYRFVAESRKARVLHIEDAGTIVEMCVFDDEKKAALGIPPGILPEGIWIGVHIDNDDAWKGVRAGVFRMFSIRVKTKRVFVPADRVL